MRFRMICIFHFLVTMVLAVLLSAGNACAESYEVTNTNNSGTGSLRQAITNANNHAGADTIIFSVATDGLPIILAGAAGDDINVSGDLDILDSGDLTIHGNGSASTIISGGWVDRVFHICPGVGCDNTVTIKSLTISNGGIDGGHGGGIYNDGTLNLLNGSMVRANMATYGGGIYNRGMLNVSNSTIGEAGASNSAVDSGGGICNVLGTVILKNSTVTANLAYDGGGIYNYINSEIRVDGSTVSSNTAGDGSSGDGGGIHNEGTLIVRNASTIGGTGTGNTAGGVGGGIYNGTTSTTTVDDSIVSTNSATVSGGIHNEGTLNVTNSIIGGKGTGNSCGQGGGGINNGTTGTTTVDGSSISANIADFGGGIENNGTLNVTNSTIGGAGAGNSSYWFGGGIYNGAAGTTTLVDSTVSANKIQYDGYGGGIFNNGTLIVTNSTIGGEGTGNSGGLRGGGISNGTTGTATVVDSIISANKAKYGGGIQNYGTLNVSKSAIGGVGAGNQSTIWGGGIYNSAGSILVTASCILNNRAIINGGGLFNDVDSFEAVTVTGSSIVGNSATSFFNNQDAMQSATGNWWGVATGPNTAGADTAAGNVDTGGFLTKPIHCPKEGTFPWSLFLPAITCKERP